METYADEGMTIILLANTSGAANPLEAKGCEHSGTIATLPQGRGPALDGIFRAASNGAFIGCARWGPMLKRAVLFDVDGTLVDSNDAHVKAWKQAFAAEGFVFGRAEIHAQIGKGGDNLVPSLLPLAAADIQARIDRAHGEIYKRDFLAGVEPFAGAKDILKRLVDRGHTVVLASSASRNEVDRYIQLLDADGLLSGSTSKDEVASSKPCPDIFVTALALTGCPAESALVIGDTPYDIIAARRAGIDAIAVLSGGFDEAELRSCRPVAIYRDVAELDDKYESSVLFDPEIRAQSLEA